MRFEKKNNYGRRNSPTANSKCKELATGEFKMQRTRHRRIPTKNPRIKRGQLFIINYSLLITPLSPSTLYQISILFQLKNDLHQKLQTLLSILLQLQEKAALAHW
jgi:hypothetical protein